MSRGSPQRWSAGCWLSAVFLTLSLAACGSSSSAPKTANSRPQARSPSKPVVSSECRTVSDPPPKGNLHIPRPTLKLDPSRRYVVNLSTNCGKIEIALDVKQAPKTAASFAYLVQRGFYDDLTFHRVVAGFVIQGGDPDGNGSGGPGYTIVEKPPADVHYSRGVVAMANTTTDPPGASGSQFFIVTGSNVELPAQYALLGEVIGGQRTVQAITRVATTTGPDGEDSKPRIPIVIDKATLQVH